MNCRQSAVLLIAAPTALGLAACGGRTLDTDKLQPKIKQGIERQAGVKLRSVDCPSHVEIKAHSRFTCTAVTTSGDRAPVLVTQQDARGNVIYQVNK